MAKVFISYDREDSDFAELMQARLEKAGHNTLMDIEFLNAGDDWRDELDQAIRDSHVLVVIMTPDAAASDYVAYEWAFALGAHGRIIPLELKTSTFHPRLDVLQRLDFTDKARPWPILLAEVAKAAEAKPITTVSVPVSAPPVIQQAVKSLDSLNEDEQQAGIKSLAQTDHPVAREALVQALQHPVEHVRFTAALEFPHKEDVRRLPGLIDYLRYFRKNRLSGFFPTQFHHQVMAMGLPSIPYLFEALQDQDPGVCRIIADVLGDVGDVSAAPRLIDALQDKDERVRCSVIKALGKVGDTTALPALHEALKDASDDVRAAAIKVLGKLSDDTIADELLRYLQDDTEAPQVQAASAVVLGQLGVSGAVPILRQWLQNRDKFRDIRESAAKALGLLDDGSAIDDLCEVFHVETGEDRSRATLLSNTVGVALIQLQGVKAFPLISEAAKVCSSGIAPVIVIEAMGAVGESAIPALRDMLTSKSRLVREAVVRTLKIIGTAESLAAAKQWERKRA